MRFFMRSRNRCEPSERDAVGFTRISFCVVRAEASADCWDIERIMTVSEGGPNREESPVFQMIGKDFSFKGELRSVVA